LHRFLSAGSGSTWHGNVVFNFTREPVVDLTAFARGYHEAGQRLVPHIAESNGYADYEGYPILYLYRHSLELFLKAAAMVGLHLRALLGEEVSTKELFTQHRLLRLFDPFCEAVKAAGYELTPETLHGSGLSSFDDLKVLLADLDQLDYQSQAFRYPVRRDGSAGVLPRHSVFNVITFAASMDPLLRILDGCVCACMERFNATVEGRDDVAEE
jgi:hypothetical protein